MMVQIGSFEGFQQYYMQKNFLIKKYSSLSNKKSTIFQSSSLILLSKPSSHSSTQPRLNLKDIQQRVKHVWEVIGSLNVEISQQAVLKYIKKTMQRKCYRYVDFILQCFKNKRVSKFPFKPGELNCEQLIYQLEDLKIEVENFLWRKFCKDIDIIEEKIKMEDEKIRYSMELGQYQALTGSFQPHLISNPADLVDEFRSIGGHPTKRSCSRLQQMRYQKLAQTERNVSNMHNMVSQTIKKFQIFN